MTCHFPCDLTLMAFFLSFAIRYCSISDLTWTTYAAFHSTFQPSNEKITEPLLMSSTVQGHQFPSSSTAFCFEANCLWKRNCVFGQPCIQLVQSKQGPVSFCNSSASLRMCRLKLEFLMNYPLLSVRVEVVMRSSIILAINKSDSRCPIVHSVRSHAYIAFGKLWWRSNGSMETKFDRMTDNDLHVKLKPEVKVFLITY